MSASQAEDRGFESRPPLLPVMKLEYYFRRIHNHTEVEELSRFNRSVITALPEVEAGLRENQPEIFKDVLLSLEVSIRFFRLLATAPEDLIFGQVCKIFVLINLAQEMGASEALILSFFDKLDAVDG